MDNMQLGFVWMSSHLARSIRDEGGNGLRVMTAAELDALAEPLWRWREAASFLKRCVYAVVPGWRSRVAGAPNEPLIVSAETV